jgi:hypothetical protein
MKCSKCNDTTMSVRYYTRRELAKGSPSRGKNRKWNEVKIKELRCSNCQTVELTYG